MSLDLAGRVVVVTGAGKGLGRAHAELLASLGARIVVNNRVRTGQPSSAEEVAAGIRTRGGEAVANTDAVEDEAGAARMVEAAFTRWGRLDGLVLNAGVSQGATLHKTPLAEFRSIMDINFYGSLYPIYAALPRLRDQGFGRIVLTTSGAGFFGVHGLTAYSASKGAVIAFGRAVALEGAARNVLTNIIAPYAATPMTSPYMRPGDIERLDPKFISPLVAWLLSPSCTANGTAVVCAGGAFRRAEAVEGPAVKLGAADLTPEGVAANWERIMSLDGAKTRADANVSFAAIDKVAAA
jgi:NAD(P)-dependent dehydrogenase (short-subunit alcohol dehydrogenase family)